MEKRLSLAALNFVGPQDELVTGAEALHVADSTSMIRPDTLCFGTL